LSKISIFGDFFTNINGLFLKNSQKPKFLELFFLKQQLFLCLYFKPNKKKFHVFSPRSLCGTILALKENKLHQKEILDLIFYYVQKFGSFKMRPNLNIIYSISG